MLLPFQATVLLAAASSAPCGLSDLVGHNWTYISPQAFKGGTWSDEHECIYQFKATGSDGTRIHTGAGPTSHFTFTSPATCMADALGQHDSAPPYNLAAPAHGNLSSNGKEVSFVYITVRITMEEKLAPQTRLVSLRCDLMLTCAHDDVMHVYFFIVAKQDSRTIDWVDSLGRCTVLDISLWWFMLLPPPKYSRSNHNRQDMLARTAGLTADADMPERVYCDDVTFVV